LPEWYCNIGGQQLGPMSSPELRRMADDGDLGEEDLVWKEGMTDWSPAKKLKGLFGPAAPAAGAQAPVLRPATPVVNMARLADVAPVLAEDVANQMPQPVVGEDAGPFFKVGKFFTIKGGSQWFGPVYASSLAFYAVKGVRRQRGPRVGGALGGAAMWLIKTAMAKDVAEDSRTCFVSELPNNIRAKIDPKGKFLKSSVIVLPKGALEMVKFQKFNNQIIVQCAGEEFRLGTRLFQKGKIKTFLSENGWRLDQQVGPTAAPIHGQHLGGVQTRVNPNPMSPLKRAAFGLLGVLLIILLIVLRIFLATYRKR
jgi:hypothetical protein